jgi:superfamily II DNA or RNA helicase/transcriptional regulator with XRE-family HTH domain
MTSGPGVPADFAVRIRRLRARLELTLARFAELLGVKPGTAKRWEKGEGPPSADTWRQIARAETSGIGALGWPDGGHGDDGAADGGTEPYLGTGEPPKIDFAANPEAVRAVAEAERLSYGHLFNPAFAAELSLVEALPHQRIAVYERMLPQPRIRFLLADDAGAGKTIMCGLLIREMLSRRVVRRVLVVPPAGLIGNWRREMRKLFRLPFRIASGADARAGNPFAGPDSDLLVVSVDTLSGEKMFGWLQHAATLPYDLVVFDEAHKLSVSRNPSDLRIDKTDRYRLAEALAGASTDDPRWSLPWSTRHLVLATATPHMGRDYPYYALWRLLDPAIFSTPEALAEHPAEAKRRYFVRRTKEEMVRYDGSRIYPKRISDTIGCPLKPDERELYDATTDYIRTNYNRARLLNRSAARLAMSVFQRRLTSSTYALLRSFERRLQRLDDIVEDIRSGRLSTDELHTRQLRLAQKLPDPLDARTTDEDEPEDGREADEAREDDALGGVVASSLADLLTERQQVEALIGMAKRAACNDDTKFERLLELVRNPQHRDEKLLIFTEHRDTANHLVLRLRALGDADGVGSIHGGMGYQERQEQADRFNRATEDGGTRWLVCTDAAAEGINLQERCWLMVNYDIPWNPARLEQRMGRIHRYGQNHDPVHIVNLVADPDHTREGRVLKTLLDKLEDIRKALGSDKVYDVVGQLFEDVTLATYMEGVAVGGNAEEAARKLGGQLTKEQVAAIEERNRRVFGDGGEVARELDRVRAELPREELRRLLPGYVRRFIERTAPLLHIGLDGELDQTFALRALHPGALDALLPAIEEYPPEQRNRFAVVKPPKDAQAVFLHPGEPVFDRFRSWVASRLGREALRGGVFLDPGAEGPYFLHVALISVVRLPGDSCRTGGEARVLEQRLVGIRVEADGACTESPVEQLLVLRGVEGVPLGWRNLAETAETAVAQGRSFAVDHVAREAVEHHRKRLLQALPARIEYLRQGFKFEEAELAGARSRLGEKARLGDARAQRELVGVKEQQQALQVRRAAAFPAAEKEPELVSAGDVRFVAHALVVPSADPEERKRYDREIELIAMRFAAAHEEAEGRQVRDVSTPEKARAAGLTDYPGFDLLSQAPGQDDRAIEVKGRARIGDVELSENEWAAACTQRCRYWLYAVMNCASPVRRLVTVRDPFGTLLARAKGGVVIAAADILQQEGRS